MTEKSRKLILESLAGQQSAIARVVRQYREDIESAKKRQDYSWENFCTENLQHCLDELRGINDAINEVNALREDK